MSTTYAAPGQLPAVAFGARTHALAGRIDWSRLPRWAWLGAGAAALPMASLKWNVAPLAWVAPVPFLLFARYHGHRWVNRFWLLTALLVATNLMTLKFFTAPIPWIMVPAYGIPIATGLWIVYLAWDAIRRRAGDRWGIYVFPALMALLETASYRLTEFGVWGAAANTQLDDLRLLQLASVAGVGGIGFMMAWTASTAAALLSARDRAGLRVHLAALLAVIGAVYTFGSLRLHAEQRGATVRVAGVVADLGPTPAGLPSGPAVAANTDELFERTREAARRGARLIVWNEAATVVEPAAESLFVRRGLAVARENRVDLVIAYIVPLATSQFRMENKYVWLSDGGEVLEVYYKHHPVPGEGSVRGKGPLKGIDRPFGVTAGAICYDYDFPGMALGHAAAGAGLIAVPASDWRGIDPYHTQMARLRAIEGGFSVVRPVRWATSAAFDAYGRSRATLSHFEDNDRIMMATLPVTRVRTIYSRIGDSPTILYVLIVIAAIVLSRRRPRTRVTEVAIGRDTERWIPKTTALLGIILLFPILA
jgi:apolipoprotein N-acyltransferase